MRLIRRSICQALAVTATLALMPTVHASDAAWPTKPIRMVVPIGPGGGTDLGARLVARKLSENLGQPVVVENRPGANGVIGTQVVAQAPADGYTLLYAPAGFAASPALVNNLPYDITKDFTPISLAARLNLVIISRSGLPVQTLAELIDYSKSHPGVLNYASTTSAVTLMVEHFKNVTGADLTAVAYRGGPNAWTDFIGERIEIIFDVPAIAKGHVEAGHGRALAMTGGTRAVEMPQVPTVAESGFPDYEVYTWQALFVRSGTPAAVLNRLEQAFSTVMKDPDVREQFVSMGLEPVGSTAEELAELVRRESGNWIEVARKANLQVQ